MYLQWFKTLIRLALYHDTRREGVMRLLDLPFYLWFQDVLFLFGCFLAIENEYHCNFSFQIRNCVNSIGLYLSRGRGEFFLGHTDLS